MNLILYSDRLNKLPNLYSRYKETTNSANENVEGESHQQEGTGNNHS